MTEGNILQGRIREIETVPQGSFVAGAGWVGRRLAIVDGSDFAREGGVFTLGDDATAYTYTGVDDTADEDYLLTTVEGVASADDRVSVFPPAVDVFARVELAGGESDTVQALVPHALRAQLADGQRDESDCEAVRIVRRGLTWYVDDVVGREVVIAASSLDPDIVARIDSADGKSQVVHAETSAPPGYAGNVGDSWFQHDSAGHTVALSRWDGTAWQPFTIDGQVVANIDAGSITSGVLSGVEIFSPSPTSTPRAELASAAFRTVRLDPDGREVVGISLGGADADRLQLLNPDGTVLAGYDEHGAGTASSMDISGVVSADGGEFDSLSINGNSFSSYLDPMATGVIARQRLGTTASGNGVRFGSAWLGFYELFYSAPGRVVKVSYHGLVNCATAGTFNFRLISTSNPSPTTTPASPKADASTGTVLDQVTVQAPSAGYYAIHLEGWTGPYAGSQRVLLSANTPTSNAYGTVYSADNAPAYMWAEDMGVYSDLNDGGYNKGGGTPYSGGTTPPAETPPVVQKKSYTSTWLATEVATFRAGMGSMSTASYKLQQGSYDGKRRWSIAVFGGNAVSGESGKSLASALSGATVSKIEFYGLVAESYYAAGGTASLAPSGITSAANGLNANTATNETRVSGWKSNVARWVTLANVGVGVRSVLIGPDTSTLEEYMKFDPALSRLQLRVTYTR